MSTTAAPICVACKHFQGWDDDSFGGTCAAYPKSAGGIPRAILLNQVDHRHAYTGDNGVTFTPKDKTAAKYPALVFAHGAGGKLSETIPAPSGATAESDNKE